MCGRFTLRTQASAWCQQFFPQLDPGPLAEDNFAPRYNIAPTQSIPCVMRDAGVHSRQLLSLRWGLIPSWADSVAIGNRMINARAETVDSKPSFRRAFAHRRCLIPADGYYEWKKRDDGKQPYLIEADDGQVFAFAGLWEENRKAGSDGEVIRSCTVITTAANQQTSAIHQRMPVIIDPEDYARWLDPEDAPAETLQSLLQPSPEGWLRLTPVSRHVNSPRHDDAECVAPVDIDSV